MTRPVKNYKTPTLVTLEVLLYAILDVVSAQMLLVMKETDYHHFVLYGLGSFNKVYC